MYHGFREACEGFCKNLFPAFDGNIPLFAFVWLWLLLAFLEPLAVLALCAFGLPLSPSLCALATVAVVLSLLLWGLAHWRFRFPLYLALFYPVTVTLGVVIAARSMTLTLRGKASWRGRALADS